MSNLITITGFHEARETFRQKHLRQGLYDAGEVIMSDVIVNLHGEQHRDRRRLENRLYTRETFREYEEELFPPIIEATMAPHLAAGRAELVSLAHQLMMNLAAYTAGVDRPLGTAAETEHLYSYLKIFIDGATLEHYVGDKAAKRAEVAAALESFDEEFLAPSITRRRALLADVDAGSLEESALPRDVLTVLLRNTDKLPLEHETIRREIAFYLLAGAHTSATAFVRVLHNVLEWLATHPQERSRIRSDPRFVQRCMHETVRLQPSSPIAARWATEDITLSTGRTIAQGDRVVIDLLEVNRDPEVFGESAQDFDPNRGVPEGIAPYGLSFGLGMHACIGQDLAAGVAHRGEGASELQLLGLVPLAVQYLFDHGCERDLLDPPEMDPSTTRPYFGRYPVVFAGT